MNTNEIKIGEKIFALFKGVPGSGKSIAAHSIYIKGPTFTFDFDRKMDAVASRYRGVDFEFEQFEDVFDALKMLERLRNNCPYKSIIWDGWHSFVSLALQTSMSVRQPGKKRVMKGDIETYQLEDYLVEGRAIEQATMDLQWLYKNKNVNIITVAHWRRVEVQDIVNKRTEILEGLFIPGGKMAYAVPVPYNELYWFDKTTDINDGNIKVFCETNGSHETKTVLKVPDRFSVSRDENFYEKLMSFHEREMKVVAL